MSNPTKTALTAAVLFLLVGALVVAVGANSAPTRVRNIATNFLPGKALAPKATPIEAEKNLSAAKHPGSVAWANMTSAKQLVTPGYVQVELYDQSGAPVIGVQVQGMTRDGQTMKAEETSPGRYDFGDPKGLKGKFSLSFNSNVFGNAHVETEIKMAKTLMVYTVSAEKSGGNMILTPGRPASKALPSQLVGGDTCASATVINPASLPYTDSGNTCGSANNYTPYNCGYDAGAADVVYSIAPTVTGPYNIDLCTNANHDTVLYIYDNTCASGNEVYCNDDYCPNYGLASGITNATLTQGHTYYIVVDGYYTACGTYTLTVQAAPNPQCVNCTQNEVEPNCGLPDTVNGGCNSSPNVFGTIACNGYACGTSAFNGSYRDTDWFLFTLTQAAQIHNRGRAEFAAQPLTLLMGQPPNAPCSAITILNYAFPAACTNWDLALNVAPGLYCIWDGPQFTAVFQCNSQYNHYQNFLDCIPLVVPPNDECSGALPVGVPSVTAGSTTMATNSHANTCSGVTDVAPDVWYQVVGTGNTITATLCDADPIQPGSANFDTRMTVMCYTCQPFPNGQYCVTANDDNCSGSNSLASAVSWCSEPGRTYYILIHGFSVGSMGQFNLSVYDDGVACPPPYPICEPCVTCDPLAPGMENEPNCGLPDTVNGGCNWYPYRFGTINCDVQMCGSGAFNGYYRDTDWYQVNFPGKTKWMFTVQSMFDHLQGLIAGGGVDCGSTTGYVAPYALGSFCQVTTTSGIVNAGPQWFFVAPQFTSIINCPAKYSALLTCEPMGACCMPDESCQQATEDDCLNQFGGVSWLGAYTQCPGKAYQNVGAGGAFEDIRNTGTIAYNSTNYADTGDAGIPIGFAFTFYGNIFTTCTVAPKGYVTFDATPTADYTPDPIPSTNPPNNLVAALWQDLNPPGYPGSASVRYQMLGAPPNRHFVVQWTNVPRYWATGSNTFQLALYENGDIEYRYLAFDSPGNVSGIENSSGTEGLPVTAAQNSSLKISLVAVAGVSCNLPPVCKAGGPYAGECGQGIQLDGSSTFDPGGDPFTYLWTSDCPNATFDNPGAARPVLTSHGITQCPFTCTVTLTATDDEGAMSSCSAQVTMTDTVAPVASAELNPVSFICPRLANEYPGCKGAHAKVVVNCADTCGANSVGTATLNGVPVVDGEDIFVRVLFPWDTDKCPEVIFPDEGIECPVKQFCGHSFKLDSTCTDVCGNVGHGSDVFQCNFDEDEEGDWHDVPGNKVNKVRRIR